MRWPVSLSVARRPGTGGARHGSVVDGAGDDDAPASVHRHLRGIGIVEANAGDEAEFEQRAPVRPERAVDAAYLCLSGSSDEVDTPSARPSMAESSARSAGESRSIGEPS